MKTTVSDEKAVKLQVAPDGVVWSLDGDQMPIATDLTVKEYLRDCRDRKLDQVRLTGTASNTQLIVALYTRMLTSGNPASLQVCSPLICSTSSRRNQPELMLYDMRRNGTNLPNSMGGWHEVTKKDDVSYSMLSQLQLRGEINDDVRKLYREHPVYKALTFIPHLNHDSCIFLLSSMIDPRWYVSQQDPNRLNQLFNFLGLDEQTQLGVNGNAPARKRHNKCKLVLSAWKTTEKPDNNQSSFLWRTWLSAKDSQRGDLRASQKFAEYIYSNWMHELLFDEGRTGGEALFVPEHFFSSRKDAEAYRQHMA